MCSSDLKIIQTEIALAARRRPENLTAYDYYLRALPQSYLATREGLADALRLAHLALELHPRFGGAATLAGLCHMRNVIFGFADDPQFDRREAVRLSRLALSLDDSNPFTLATAALISAYMVVKINHDSSGKVTGVVYADKTGTLQEQKARVVCVAGNSVETPRLLLNSQSSKFPNGLANSSGQVGRNYMRATGATGLTSTNTDTGTQ